MEQFVFFKSYILVFNFLRKFYERRKVLLPIIEGTSFLRKSAERILTKMVNSERAQIVLFLVRAQSVPGF
jgi:hypothetical protein